MINKHSQLKRIERFKPMIRCHSMLPILFAVMGMTSVAIADTPKEVPTKVVSFVSKVGCKKQQLPARVIAIGSSTMRGALGPRLSRVFKKDPNISFHLWGKSATGLARPDFFDWPKKVVQLIDKKKPDAWIVSLGTNDFQGLRMPDRSWIRFGSDKWIAEYTVRVRKLLEQMAGTDRKRTIIYIGPTAYSQKRFVGRMGAAISQVIREQVQAFTGPAIFYDAFSLTSTAKNKPKKSFKQRRYHIHGPDKIHLSRKALEFLLEKPVVKLLRDCLAGINPS
ncbi:MAG TPA: DUF459 domain-containing protein [Myxococcales bacterium]|nr:DUF459 domain-containing protein [Myxococcales bacterium]